MKLGWNRVKTVPHTSLFLKVRTYVRTKWVILRFNIRVKISMKNDWIYESKYDSICASKHHFNIEISKIENITRIILTTLSFFGCSIVLESTLWISRVEIIFKISEFCFWMTLYSFSDIVWYIVIRNWDKILYEKVMIWKFNSTWQCNIQCMIRAVNLNWNL